MIFQYNKDGKCINAFASYQEAERRTNIPRGTIGSCIHYGTINKGSETYFRSTKEDTHVKRVTQKSVRAYMKKAPVLFTAVDKTHGKINKTKRAERAYKKYNRRRKPSPSVKTLDALTTKIGNRKAIVIFV